MSSIRRTIEPLVLPSTSTAPPPETNDRFGTDELQQETRTQVAANTSSRSFQQRARGDPSRYLALGCDMGTSKNACAVRLYDSKDPLSSSNTFDISFHNKTSIPNVGTYKDGRIRLGQDAMELYHNGAIDASEFIKHAKLAIYDHPSTAHLKEKIVAQLGAMEKTLPSFIRDTLKEFILMALKRFRTFDIAVGIKDFDYLPVLLYLTVPQVWDRAAYDLLLGAAKQLDISQIFRVELVSEPLSAALYTFINLTDPMARAGRQTLLKVRLYLFG